MDHVNGVEVELKWNHKDLHSLRATVENHVAGRGVVVQGGACLGVFPEWLAEHFDTVYTFEPDPRLHRASAARLAGCANVVLMQAALGEGSRLVRTELSLRPNDGKSSLHPGMTRTEPGGIIPTFAIDWLALPSCDLIYLDVEGDEMFALSGASATIHRCRPVLACEVNRGVEYRGFEQEDVRARLRFLGYEQAAKYRSDEVWVPLG